MKSTALHPLCTAGKMTHIHTLLKKENFLFYEIPLCRLYQVLPSEHFQPYFSFFLSIVPLLILYNLRRHFKFLLVIFSYLMQSGIWNTQVFLIYLPRLMLSPMLFTDYSNRIWLSITPRAPQRNVCSSLSHWKKNHHTSHRSSSISFCPDTTYPDPANL